MDRKSVKRSFTSVKYTEALPYGDYPYPYNPNRPIRCFYLAAIMTKRGGSTFLEHAHLLMRSPSKSHHTK